MLSCNQKGNTHDGFVYEKGSADKVTDLIGEIIPVGDYLLHKSTISSFRELWRPLVSE